MNIKDFNGGPVAFGGSKGVLTVKGPQEANHNAGTQDNIDVGDSEKEDESAQDYFVLHIWSSYSSTVKRSKQQRCRLKRQEQDANDAAEALRKEL
ncbi:hypothetical protein Tco_0398277 [Tanacetum coccineum]